MREIPLSNAFPLVALVDDSDYEWLTGFPENDRTARTRRKRWLITRNVHVLSHGYAYRRQSIDGKDPVFLMHREILNAPKGMDVDHIDHNPLNNQRHNLRLATRAQNNQNRFNPRPNKTSQFKGVSWRKTSSLWTAQICAASNGVYRSRYLGLFENEIDAARAYNEAAAEYFGEFACLNVIPVTV